MISDKYELNNSLEDLGSVRVNPPMWKNISILIFLLILSSPGIMAEKVLPDSLIESNINHSGWSKTLQLYERLHIYDFPEELIGYHLVFPEGEVTRQGLVLLDEQRRMQPHQLSDVTEREGYLVEATVLFRTDLPRHAIRQYLITHRDTEEAGDMKKEIEMEVIGSGVAELRTSKQQIRVPFGEQQFAGGMHASEAPAPLLAIARDRRWVGEGRFKAGENAPLLTGINGRVLETGPLRLRYEVNYTFQGNRNYRVVFNLFEGDEHVTIDEYVDGFSHEHDLHMIFSFREGLDPDGRLMMTNGGYNGDQRGTLSGRYDQGLDNAGKLPFHLTTYPVNSLGAGRSVGFWQDDGSHGLLWAVYRPEDWRYAGNVIWNSRNEPDNIYFYGTGKGDKYARLQLLDGQRHWAMSLLPREKVQLHSFTRNETHEIDIKGMENLPRNFASYGGPEVRLFQRLTDMSLDRYKDMVFDFEEPFLPIVDEEQTYQVDYNIYWNHNYRGIRTLRNILRGMADTYYDRSGDNIHGFGSNSRYWWYDYAANRQDWTEEQRAHIRACLVFVANNSMADTHIPHHHFMGGHPNFVAEIKFDLGLAPAAFPNHPQAPLWRNEFVRFYEDLLELFTRKEDIETGAVGGRWMENVNTYWPASLGRLATGMDAVYRYDGTALADHRLYRKLVHWTMDALAPGEAINRRRLVPIGAHSYGGGEVQRLRNAAQVLSYADPKLAEEFLWCITNGQEGTKPHRESTLYRDYGPALWYDFGGENEAFVTLQQLHGQGYRWTSRSNGTIYYTSHGQRWSWNAHNDNGDRLNLEQLPMFYVDKDSELTNAPVDDLLYNFGNVQYYRLNNGQQEASYRGRAVMMIRNHFLAVYDDVADHSVDGEFRWHNYQSHFQAEYYNDTRFEDLKIRAVPHERFLMKWNWGEGSPLEVLADNPDLSLLWAAPNPEINVDRFSIRWTGAFKLDTDSRRKFGAKMGDNDVVRLWIDDQLVLDSSEGIRQPYNFRANEFHNVVIEYEHHGGDAHFDLLWGENSMGSIQHGATYSRLPMPNIYPVSEGSGDQLHLVAAEPLEYAVRDWGVIVDEREYVFFSDRKMKVTDKSVLFSGKVGYASKDEVALFDGDMVGYGNLVVHREKGDFGVSAAMVGERRLEGRITGRTGGKITIRLPKTFGKLNKLTVWFDDRPIPYSVTGNELTFDFIIQPADGYKTFVIENR